MPVIGNPALRAARRRTATTLSHTASAAGAVVLPCMFSEAQLVSNTNLNHWSSGMQQYHQTGHMYRATTVGVRPSFAKCEMRDSEAHFFELHQVELARK